MSLSLPVRIRTSWFVLIAFIIATLVPTLGMARGESAAPQMVWAQLCSAEGPKRVAIDVNGNLAAPSDVIYDSHTGHCLLCFQPSTPPQSTPVTPVAVSTLVLRVSAAIAAQGDHFRAWSTPLPRAPPSFT